MVISTYIGSNPCSFSNCNARASEPTSFDQINIPVDDLFLTPISPFFSKFPPMFPHKDLHKKMICTDLHFSPKDDIILQFRMNIPTHSPISFWPHYTPIKSPLCPYFVLIVHSKFCWFQDKT